MKKKSICCIYTFIHPLILQRKGVGAIHTILRKHAQLLYVLHAVDGQPCWVTLSVHPLVVHIDHMPQFWDP